MTDPTFGVRLRSAAAAVGDRPELAATLANSDLTEGDMGLVGGFTQALETAQLVRLARNSGARTELSAQQRSQLDAVGESYQDVNDGPDGDPRNWLERIFDAGATALANTGAFLSDLPGVGQVLDGLNWLNDVAHLPARLISSGIDQSNDDEVDAAMRLRGYDPSSPVSYIAFMAQHGENLYHDLDGLRQTYGDELVDLAIEQQWDPQKFAETLVRKDERVQQLAMSDEFVRVSDLVDRKHISPGRDIARLLLPEGLEDTAGFTAISGTLDGAYTILLDPTLLAGKAAAGVRALDHAGNAINQASRLDRITGIPQLTQGLDRVTGGRFRSGLRDATDQDGIRGLLAVDDEGRAVTSAGRGVQEFLGKVKEFDEATDEAVKTRIFADLQATHRPLMPFFDEVRGQRVLTPPAQAAWKRAEEQPIDFLDEAGVAEAVGGGLDDTQRSWVNSGLNILGRRKLADSPAARRSFLAVTNARLGRTIKLDESLLDDAGRGSRQRFDAAFRDALNRSEAPTPGVVHTITDAGPPFDGKLVDVNGVGWLTTNAEPIRDLKEFADYFASTAGLLRMAGGAAAKREILLPGRVALRQRAAGAIARKRQDHAAERNARIYDHSNPYRLLPHEAEENLQKALDDVARLEEQGAIDAAEAARRGDLIYQEMRGQAGIIARQRAKWEQRSRRVSSLLPTVQAIDLTSAGSIEQVRRFARLYMNKTEADRLTTLYAAGDLGRRRQVVNGIIEQTLHAAGLSRSETGLKQIELFRADQMALDARAYGLSRTDVITDANGLERHVALLPSQLSEKVLIPDFRALQYLATKHAVGGVLTRAGHLRAGATSETMDSIIGAIKLGWITSPAGGFRNALDEVANLVLRGEGTSLLRGRAAFSKAVADTRVSGAEAQRAARLQTRIWASIPRALRGIPRTVNDVLVARGLGRAMSFGRPIDDDMIKHAGELVEDYRAEVLDKTVTGTYLADDALDANAEALAMHKSGLAAKQVKHNGQNVQYEFQGWGMVEVDGGVGLDSLANSLGQAFQDLSSPAHVALRGITEGRDALTDVVEYMQTPVMRHFLANAEVFKVTRSGKAVQTAEDQLEAIEAYAERLIAHTTMLVTGRGRQIAEADEAAGAAARWEFDITRPNWWREEGVQPGPINQDLVAMLQRGEIPDRIWLKENLTPEELPSHAVGKRFAPVNPQHKAGQIAQGYTAMLSKGYDFLVTRQIRAISRNPMLTAAYDQARRNMAGYEKALKDAGFSDEAAEAVVRRSARTQAEQLVIKSIDDPTLSTQYAMLARNWHAFARAQEDWLRRWGRTIRDDPLVVRRAQLAIHGGESAGILERDDEGNLIFTYPGSGAIITALGKITSALPGMPNMARLPVVPDLTSRLIFLNPSLDNPAGFSATPLLSIPFDALASLTGSDHALLMSSMDRVVNGELGAGRTWFEKLMPGVVNRMLASVPDEDLGSQYGSAAASAIANMEAAGRLDELNGADPTQVARFQNDLQAQIANQMFMRAIMGFFLPAAPSLPTNDVTDVETGERILQPDFVWEKAGLASLKDEARHIFSQLPYEEALVWWQKNHPGELVFQPSGATAQTSVGGDVPGAQAPATIAAAKWLQENPYLVENYGKKGGIATYFIPQGDGTGGEFSMDAYRAQLEMGIREHKSLDQFFENIVIQRGENVYFDTKDDVDAAIAAATAAGDTYQVKQIEDWWSQRKELIKAANPLMAAKFAEFATSGIARDRVIGQLNQMLSDPEAIDAIGADRAGGVAELLLAQREYEAARQAVLYERGYYATSRREEAKANFEAAIASVVARFPGLGDLARGAFRVPD